MSDWTPGPWSTYIGPDNELYVNGVNGEPICQVDLDMSVDTQLSNAYLIAAAPELVEIVEHLAYALSQCRGKSSLPHDALALVDRIKGEES